MISRRRLLFAGALALAPVRVRAQYQPQGRKLVARLAAAQAPDGALLMPGTGPERLCRPHSGNRAVTGLLLGAPPRSRSEAAETAKKWIGWYVRNLNANGSIDEFRGAPGALKPTGKYENSDACAGTFLSLALAYLDQTGDHRTLLAAFDRIEDAAEMILRTLQPSGLTHARPDHAVAYLVNNIEAWQGFDSFERLCAKLRKPDLSREYRAQADALLAAIDQWMWQPKEGYYAWALRDDGTREFGLEKLSPDWIAQLAAIALLPPNERRDDLLKRLSRLSPPLPRQIETVEELERVLWWGRVMVSRYDQQVLERYQLLLSRAPWDRFQELDPAIIGLALRVGRGRAQAPPPLPEDDGLF